VPSLTSTVAANIRGRRAALDWKQEDLAARLGWTQRVVSRIERGERTLDLDELARICHVLDIGLADLLAGAEREASASLRLPLR
jgi:transcriptional regulator with XRE-family HTH domain